MQTSSFLAGPCAVRMRTVIPKHNRRDCVRRDWLRWLAAAAILISLTLPSYGTVVTVNNGGQILVSGITSNIGDELIVGSTTGGNTLVITNGGVLITSSNSASGNIGAIFGSGV